MNGPDTLKAARNAGARFRLGASGNLDTRGLDRIPADLDAAVRIQSAWVADTLAAEIVARSPLPWHRHGPGWLAVIDPDDTGDGTRLLIGRTGWRWWLTQRPTDNHLTVIVAKGTLGDVLAEARAIAPVAP